MRQIKFRAWNVNNKRFVYLVIGHHSRNPVIAPPPDVKNLDEWQQFTALKDSKGVEIYEGDIVKIKHRDYLGIIRWRDCGFYIDEGSHAEKNFVLNITSADEVIGNRFENSELLKGGEK